MEKKQQEKKSTSSNGKRTTTTAVVVEAKTEIKVNDSVQQTETILKHAENLRSFTKVFTFLKEKEENLNQVIEAYNAYDKKKTKQGGHFFKEENIEFDFVLSIQKKNASHREEPLVEIQNPEVLNSFVKVLAGYIGERKAETVKEINDLEKQYAESIVKK